MKLQKSPTVVAIAVSCALLLNQRAQSQIPSTIQPSAAVNLDENSGIENIVDVSRRRLLEKAFQTTGRLIYPTWSQDGKQLFYGNFNPYTAEIYALSLTTQSQIKDRKLGDEKYVEGRKPTFRLGTSRAFSPDGKIFATGSSGAGQEPVNDSIQLWDTRTWQQIGVLKGHPHTVSSIVFSPDGKTIISGNDGGGVIIHDVAKRTLLSAWFRGLFIESRVPATVAFWNREGKIVPIAVVRHFRDAYAFWDLRPIEGSVFAPEETVLGDFEIWDIEANRKIKDLKLPRPYPVFNPSLNFCADGRLLAFFSISTEEAEADESGNPHYATIMDWEKDHLMEVKINSALFITFGPWNTLQFLPNQPTVLFSDVATDRLLTIDISALTKP